MASLLTDEQKAAFADARVDLFDTFARPITVFKTPEKTIISTASGYNFAYGEGDQTITYTPVSGVFDARIVYFDKTRQLSQGGNMFFNEGADFKLSQKNPLVKIIIKESGYLFLAETEKVEFDGVMFKRVGPLNRHYYLGANLYKVYLEGIQ